MQGNQNANRGRPLKGTNEKGVEKLIRSTLGVAAYDEARASGMKYGPAIDFAVAAVRQAHPLIPMSRPEMKRVLADFRPRGFQKVLVTKCDGSNACTVSLGPRPNDRVNRGDRLCIPRTVKA